MRLMLIATHLSAYILLMGWVGSKRFIEPPPPRAPDGQIWLIGGPR